MTHSISGLITHVSNAEESDLLGVGGHIFAETFQDLVEDHGNLVSVRYYISDKSVDPNKLKEDFLLKVLGCANVDYSMHYTELTGYLWTTEELTIGGHDLLNELETHLNKYLYMEIDFHDRVAWD